MSYVNYELHYFEILFVYLKNCKLHYISSLG